VREGCGIFGLHAAGRTETIEPKARTGEGIVSASTPRIPPASEWRCREHSLSFESVRVMGILNVTPDSFSDGGRFLDLESAVARAREMAAEGADIIDIGGESSRPGSEPVDADEELRRVAPVLERLRGDGLVLSIDTAKARVARAALDAGACIVNDVTALRGDPDMAALVAESGAGVVLMHMLGTPKSMQTDPRYDNVVRDIARFFEERREAARRAGIDDRRIVFDPGIGFGKTLEHNLEILRRLGEFLELGRPILIGPSRKAFLGRILGSEAGDRVEGTAAAVAASVLAGASILRVHDVRAMARVAKVAHAIRTGSRGV
jgi:dihydropteroate synthase